MSFKLVVRDQVQKTMKTQPRGWGLGPWSKVGHANFSWVTANLLSFLGIFAFSIDFDFGYTCVSFSERATVQIWGLLG